MMSDILFIHWLHDCLFLHLPRKQQAHKHQAFLQTKEPVLPGIHLHATLDYFSIEPTPTESAFETVPWGEGVSRPLELYTAQCTVQGYPYSVPKKLNQQTHPLLASNLEPTGTKRYQKLRIASETILGRAAHYRHASRIKFMHFSRRHGRVRNLNYDALKNIYV